MTISLAINDSRTAAPAIEIKGPTNQINKDKAVIPKN